MNRLTLALDVMGGDIGPRITIPASLSALEADPMLSLVLFGDSQQISPLLENAPSSLLERIQIHHCTKTIDNNQGISHALRHSKGTSMRLAIEMVSERRGARLCQRRKYRRIDGIVKGSLTAFRGDSTPCVGILITVDDG